MHWTEPASAEDSHSDLEKRLWDAANKLWADAALKPSEFSPIVLGTCGVQRRSPEQHPGSVPFARVIIGPNGARPGNPVHHPGTTAPVHEFSPNGARPNTRRLSVPPRWGWGCLGAHGPQGDALRTQGDALGYRVVAPLARRYNHTNGTRIIPGSIVAKPNTLRQRPCPNGAKPCNPGHRPGTTASVHESSPTGPKPLVLTCRNRSLVS